MSELIYDTKIAPLLAEAGQLCKEYCLPFVAQVEYEPNQYGLTHWFDDEASLVMNIMFWSARAGNNVDSLILKIIEYARAHGHSSAMLKALGVPTVGTHV